MNDLRFGTGDPRSEGLVRAVRAATT
jgi:hypothetical protein